MKDLSSNNNNGIAETSVQNVYNSPLQNSSSNCITSSNCNESPTAIALNNSNFLYTNNLITNPQVFSVGGWFKTLPNNSGTIIGFQDTQKPVPGNYDRAIWLNSAGDVVTGINNGSLTELSSGNTSYANGNWNFVVVTLSSSGFYLYINGGLVASNTSAVSAQAFNGYWLMGYGNEGAGWPNPPGSPYFTGSLSNIFWTNSALSSSQIVNLYSQNNQNSFENLILSYNPLAYWPLNSFISSDYFNDASMNSNGAISAYAPVVDYNDVYSTYGNTCYSGCNTLSMNFANNTFTGLISNTINDQYIQYLSSGNGSAVAFNGSSNYAYSNSLLTNPQTFSIGGWFKVPPGDNGGTIIGFQNTQTTGPSDYDRGLWINAYGNVVGGVNMAGTLKELITPQSYDNNMWHLAILTLSPTSGLSLYVDGQLINSNPSVTSAQVFNGYWVVGYGNENAGWPNPPGSVYFSGSISNVFFYNSVLNEAAVSNLYTSSTQNNFQTAINNNSPSAYWPMTTINGSSISDQSGNGNNLSFVGTFTADPSSVYPTNSNYCLPDGFALINNNNQVIMTCTSGTNGFLNGFINNNSITCSSNYTDNFQNTPISFISGLFSWMNIQFSSSASVNPPDFKTCADNNNAVYNTQNQC